MASCSHRRAPLITRSAQPKRCPVSVLTPTVPGVRRIGITGPGIGAIPAAVPETRRERMRGLRGSTHPREEALLLERCRSVHTFGMSRPITVAFLDADLHVLRVVRAPPGRLLFSRRARHVLECHIGAHVRTGDVLVLRDPRG